MTWFLAKLKTWAAVAGVFLVTVAGAYFLGRQDGTHNAEVKSKDDLLDDVAVKHEIENDVRSLDDDALRKRVSRWTHK